MPRKNEFTESMAVLHFSGLLITLHKKFVKNYQKLHDSTMILGYIFINRIQPFETATILALQLS